MKNKSRKNRTYNQVDLIPILERRIISLQEKLEEYINGGGPNVLNTLFVEEVAPDGTTVTRSINDLQVPLNSVRWEGTFKQGDTGQQPSYTTFFDNKRYLIMGYELTDSGTLRPSVKVSDGPTDFDLQPFYDVTHTFNTPVLFSLTSQQNVFGVTYRLKLDSDADVRLEVFREADPGGERVKIVDETFEQSMLSLDGFSFKLNPVVDFVTGTVYTLQFTSPSGVIRVKGTEINTGGTYGISKAANTQFFPYVRRDIGFVYTTEEIALMSDLGGSGGESDFVKSSTPPSDTSKVWFNTNDKISYFYDTDAWVSEQLFSVDFNDQGSTPNNTFLRVGNTTCNNVGVGYNMPFEARVKGLSYSRNPSTAKMGNFWMYSDAITSPSSVVLTFTVDSSGRGFIESPVKTDIPATRYIAFRWNGNQTNNNILTLQYRKKHV